MKLAGFTLGGVIKIGVAATLFIIALKFAAAKAGIPALQRVAALA